MIKLRRSTTILWLFFGVLVLAAPFWAQTRPPEIEKLAKTYGLDSYGQIEAVRYTFNLDLPALKVNLSRTWTWEPKTGQVTYETKDKDGKPVKVTYNRSQLNSAPPQFARRNPGHRSWQAFRFRVGVSVPRRVPQGPAPQKTTKGSSWNGAT